MKKLLFIAFLSFISIILPASYACEKNKPNQIGKEWKSEDKIKYIAIVNNEKEVKCDMTLITDEHKYGFRRGAFNKEYECEQFRIIHQANFDRFEKDAWILVDKNKKTFYLDAEKENCVCKDTGTNKNRKSTIYCKQNLQEDYTKIQLKSEIEFVLTDKERPQL